MSVRAAPQRAATAAEHDALRVALFGLVKEATRQLGHRADSDEEIRLIAARPQEGKRLGAPLTEREWRVVRWAAERALEEPLTFVALGEACALEVLRSLYAGDMGREDTPEERQILAELWTLASATLVPIIHRRLALDPTDAALRAAQLRVFSKDLLDRGGR